MSEAIRTYLEMTSRAALAGARPPSLPMRIERVHGCPASFYRYLYSEVGRAYRWIDRLGWSDQQICAYLARPEIELWLLASMGAPAGYGELERAADGAVEIVYFGLLPEFVGRGVGGWFLSEVVERAWTDTTTRVWLHTCTFDHPHALANYLARGFTIERQEHFAAPQVPAPEAHPPA